MSTFLGLPDGEVCLNIMVSKNTFRILKSCFNTLECNGDNNIKHDICWRLTIVTICDIIYYLMKYKKKKMHRWPKVYKFSGKDYPSYV